MKQMLIRIRGGATVRCRVYSRWEADTVGFSQPPLFSLGAEAVRLGLSVGRKLFEPQCESVKLLSLVRVYRMEADTVTSVAGNNIYSLSTRMNEFHRGLRAWRV